MAVVAAETSPRRFPARRRLARVAAVLVVMAGLAWAIGLAVFVRSLPRASTGAEGKGEAIVVLTGGSQRVEAGLALLEAGAGEQLFVSGVHGTVDREAILAANEVSSRELGERMVLGHEAADTTGNARETAAWLESQGYATTRLVTATYHMPRARLEFAIAAPGIEVVPHPVEPRELRGTRWWRNPQTAGLIVREYNKYLYALARYATHRLLTPAG